MKELCSLARNVMIDVQGDRLTPIAELVISTSEAHNGLAGERSNNIEQCRIWCGMDALKMLVDYCEKLIEEMESIEVLTKPKGDNP